MEQLLTSIIECLRQDEAITRADLEKLVKVANQGLTDNEYHISKGKLLTYFAKQKELNSAVYQNWQLSEEIEQRLLALLQIKPGRTTSGVATITVITKPWTCSSNCIYCPVDVRMPKSYLYSEPACQRAERNYFDPFLQVISRLRALIAMGHPTDKVELIVLGGTWSDYPTQYQIWFMTELFRALNLQGNVDDEVQSRRKFYKDAGLDSRDEVLASQVKTAQSDVDTGNISFNEAVRSLYTDNPNWQKVAKVQTATLDELYAQHILNEKGQHRSVGLVIETRPDLINTESLTLLRKLGCTKVQIGVQSLDENILKLNQRNIAIQQIQECFALLRLFGFKTHAHIMLNLLGSSPTSDKAEYKEFVTNPHYIPDEIKLYPCSLIKGTKLCSNYDNKTWAPYAREELVEVLVADVLVTPPYTRISRMIRDIGVDDILAGNKQSNLRQLVELETMDSRLRGNDRASKNSSAGELSAASPRNDVQEMRYREIRSGEFDVDDLSLNEVVYHTSNTTEYFLQWITSCNQLIGFLRLSLPDKSISSAQSSHLPFLTNAAMIREVHIYGRSAKLDINEEHLQLPQHPQHQGLGKQLMQRAKEIAIKNGYSQLNVISAVGTRAYYRKLNFKDGLLYQVCKLL